MSVQYGAISWNRQKKIYDYTLLFCVSLYLAVFLGVGFWRNPYATAETLLIRDRKSTRLNSSHNA